MPFASHGELKLWVENNIVFMEIAGGWNLEKAKEFTQTLNTQITALVKPPFGAIGILHDDWMPTADAIPHLQEATRRAIKAGLVKEAYVSTSKLSSKVTQSLVLPKDCHDYQSKEFDNISDAVAWLLPSDAKPIQSLRDACRCQ